MQGLQVIALHSVNCFHSTEQTERRIQRLRAKAVQLGATDIVFPDLSEDIIAVTKAPRYGYGKNLNACIDCRLKTVEAGFKAMRETGASFVVSGEVVGQRPMSQRRDALGLADKQIAAWGFKSLYVRPLSAKLLPQTIPEQKGWLDPNLLYAISGRSRHEQMELVEKLGIDDYPNPAGGCLLTDAAFSSRLADVMRFTPAWKVDDVELIKVGRHFLLDNNIRIVASRREEENDRLEWLAKPEDLLYINAKKNGAIVLVRGQADCKQKSLAAGLAVYFSKMRENGKAQVAEWHICNGEETDKCVFTAASIDPALVRALEKKWKKTLDQIDQNQVG